MLRMEWCPGPRHSVACESPWGHQVNSLDDFAPRISIPPCRRLKLSVLFPVFVAFFKNRQCISGVRFGSPCLRASDGDANVFNRRPWWPVCLVEEPWKNVRYRNPSLQMWR